MNETKAVVRAPRRDITRDPREDEDWFQRLPPEVQDQTREKWRHDRVKFDHVGARHKELLIRSLIAGVAVLLISSVPVGLFITWKAAGYSVPFGLALGFSWWWLRPDRILCGLMGMITMLLVLVAAGLGLGLWTFYFGVFSCIMASGFSSLCAFSRDMNMQMNG